MEKPHRPTIEELEALFGDDTTPLYLYSPPDPQALRRAVRAFLAAWDEGLTIRELSPFVENVRKALENRT
jgi:hypothetical protein